tara:strand:+ start:6705 stop:7301 length:597 start_codon:yes stop_codon:yes gene_type:complete
VAERLKASERRGKLISAARKLFTKYGYDETHMEHVAKAAHCTTGPLYYFFKTKKELFEAALFEAIGIANRSIDEARTVTKSKSPLTRLMASCDNLLDLMMIPETTMFAREAPRVLGQAEWQSLRRKLMLRSFEIDLRDAMIAGEIPPEPPGPLAAILASAIIEVIEHANAGDSEQVELYRAALRRLILRLKLPVPEHS